MQYIGAAAAAGFGARGFCTAASHVQRVAFAIEQRRHAMWSVETAPAACGYIAHCDAALDDEYPPAYASKDATTTPSFLALKWLKVAILVMRLIALRDIDDPLNLTLNVAIIVAGLLYENPKPESVYVWLQERARISSSHSDRSSALASVINSVRDAASKSSAYLNTVEVTNYGIFSIAVVRGVHGEMLLLGMLGDWFAIEESRSDSLIHVNRHLPALLFDDLLESGKELVDALRQFSFFGLFPR